MSTSKTHRAINDLVRKGGRKVARGGKAHNLFGKSVLTQASYFYGTIVGRFAAKKQVRTLESQNIILFRTDKSLDDVSLKNNLSFKEIEAKQLFANYREEGN